MNDKLYLCESCLSLELHRLNCLIVDFHYEVEEIKFKIKCEKCNNEAKFALKIL